MLKILPRNRLSGVYLEGGLAVRHSGRPLGTDNDWHMEAVVGQGNRSTGNTESFR